jgi:hypothetical protein
MARVNLECEKVEWCLSIKVSQIRLRPRLGMVHLLKQASKLQRKPTGTGEAAGSSCRRRSRRWDELQSNGLGKTRCKRDRFARESLSSADVGCLPHYFKKSELGDTNPLNTVGSLVTIHCCMYLCACTRLNL